MGGRFNVVGGGFEVGEMGDRFGVGGARGGGEFEVGDGLVCVVEGIL